MVAVRKVMLGHVDTVAKYGAWSIQSGFGIHIQIGRMVGEQAAHGGHFIQILGQMGLHVQAGCAAEQVPRQFQLFWCAGYGKARGYGIKLAVLAMPTADEVLGLVIPALGCVAQVGGQLRSISTLPAIMRVPRRADSSKTHQQIAGAPCSTPLPW